MLSLLKNWKVILGVIGLATIGFFVFDYQRVKSNYVELESTLNQSVEANESLQRQVGLAETEYEALEKSLDNYQRSLNAAQESHDALKSQLEKEARNDEMLEQCLDTSLPPNLVNSLSK